MILSEKEQKAGSSDEQAARRSRRLSRRWKLLQVVGVALIALSMFIEWPAAADTSLPQTSSFLFVLGILVLMAGWIAEKWSIGNP